MEVTAIETTTTRVVGEYGVEGSEIIDGEDVVHTYRVFDSLVTW